MLRQLLAGALILVTAASADDAPVVLDEVASTPEPAVAVSLPVVKVDPDMLRLRAENKKLKADMKASKAAESKQKGMQAMYAPATSCKTVRELLEWRKTKNDQVSRVPAAYQSFPMNDMKKDFSKHLDTLIAEATEANETQSDEEIADVQEARDLVASQDQPVPEAAPLQAEPPAPAQFAQQPPPPQPVASMQLPAEFLQQPQYEALPLQQPEPSFEPTPEFPQDCAMLARTGILRNGRLAELPLLLMQSDMCITPEDVSVWQACQFAEIDQHVPPAYRIPAAIHVKQQVEARLAQVLGRADATSIPQADTFPVFLALAQRCKTEAELRAWHEHQLEQVKNRFHAPFTVFALGALDGTFHGRLSYLVKQRQQQELGQVVALAPLAQVGLPLPVPPPAMEMAQPAPRENSMAAVPFPFEEKKVTRTEVALLDQKEPVQSLAAVQTERVSGRPEDVSPPVAAGKFGFTNVTVSLMLLGLAVPGILSLVSAVRRTTYSGGVKDDDIDENTNHVQLMNVPDV